MKLSYVTIKNYRSITDAYKIDMSNLTVLLGKNNEGKTNIIRAVKLGMSIIQDIEMFYPKRRMLRRTYYDWHEDFPIALQNSKKITDKKTLIRFDFQLSEIESTELSKKIGSSINCALSIYICIRENNQISITVPKRGKNAKAISSKIIPISNFISENYLMQYIPAVRSEEDAFAAIIDLVESELSEINDEEYKKSLELIVKVQQAKLADLASRVKQPLKNFLPQIKDINLNLSTNFLGYTSSFIGRRSICFDVDDGTLTSLRNKGDGVKSLTAIALLSQVSTTKNRLVIIDEPENHLHPEAIRYINTVLTNLSKDNQVLISTHSPIFVNRNTISSNIIVEKGKAYPAKRVDNIRNVLGVLCSDNLIYSDYVVVVEGPTDKSLLIKMLKSDKDLSKALTNNIVTIHSIGGTHNLQSEIYSLQRYCCNYFVLVDYDKAGKDAIIQTKEKLSITDNSVRYFMKSNKKDTELEDLYNAEKYKDYLLSKGIDISNNKFKNQTKKWSDRISDVAVCAGIDFSKELENELKQGIENIISDFLPEYFSEHGYHLLCEIIEKIKLDLKNMNF